MDSEQARRRVLGFITSSLVSRAVCAAAELDIPGRLTSGPKSLPELAELANCSPEHLGRLMRALVQIGLFLARDGVFELTPLSRCLTRDAENSVWPIAVMQGQELFRAQADLTSNIRDGVPAWQRAHGSTIWEYLSDHQNRAAVFDTMMTSIHGGESYSLANAYDFSSERVVVDIGGGNGSLLSAILTKYEKLSGILFDRPHVISRAAAALAGSPLMSRIRLAGGDFFSVVPSEGDVYILRYVLHDWSDDDALQILKTCRKALHERARILIVERIKDERNDLAWVDLAMMVCGGEERSAAQYRDLALAAGLSRVVVHSDAFFTLIEARQA